MKNYYIGTRLSHRAISELLGRGVYKLNNGLADTCRTVALKKGIKKTEQKRRLEFYTVTQNELEMIREEGFDMLSKLADKPVVRPLIVIDEEKLHEGLDSVNSNPEYAGGMRRDVYSCYLKELEKAVTTSITRIGDDLNTRKSRATYSHNYKIGDWIEVAAGYGYIEGHAKIIETTAKTYTYALAAIHGQRVTNFHYAKRMFNNVTGSSYDSQDWDFSIPFDGNECHFTFDSQEITKRAAQNNPKKVVPSYRSVRHARD